MVALAIILHNKNISFPLIGLLSKTIFSVARDVDIAVSVCCYVTAYFIGLNFPLFGSSIVQFHNKNSVCTKTKFSLSGYIDIAIEIRGNAVTPIVLISLQLLFPKLVTIGIKLEDNNIDRILELIGPNLWGPVGARVRGAERLPTRPQAPPKSNGTV